jgi:hypothetical protein
MQGTSFAAIKGPELVGCLKSVQADVALQRCGGFAACNRHAAA